MRQQHRHRARPHDAAHYLLTDSYKLHAGDTILVHAAAGGTGQLLCQVASSLNAKVIGIVSTPAKAEVARAAGAEHGAWPVWAACMAGLTVQMCVRVCVCVCVCARACVCVCVWGGGVAVIVAPVGGTVDWVEEVLKLTHGVGVNAVYDGVGEPTFAKGLRALRTRGTMVLYGGAGGAVHTVPVDLLARGSKILTRPSLFDFISTHREYKIRLAGVLKVRACPPRCIRVWVRDCDYARGHARRGCCGLHARVNTARPWQWIKEGTMRPAVPAVHPLSDLRKLHGLLESRATTGKLLVGPWEKGVSKF